MGGLKDQSGTYHVSRFLFSTGETLDIDLHYRTIGSRRVDPSSGKTTNAILILHGTGGSSTPFLAPTFAGVLFEPNQLLDARKYFIVLPDAIGHGGSSKPSDGLRMRFPKYTYDDLVRAQHLLLSSGLGVNHLRLVIGTSMGGMHTWMWGEMYPDMVDALMPLASLPVEIAGYNRMRRKMIVDLIKGDPAWKGGNYEKGKQPALGVRAACCILLTMTAAPLPYQLKAPTRIEAEDMLDQLLAQSISQTDANDMIYAFESSRDYNPAPMLEQIQAPLVAVNSADDLVNPPELGILDREIKRVAAGRYVLIPASEKTAGHRTHSLPEIWQEHLRKLLEDSG